jgi:hypothetical protein
MIDLDELNEDNLAEKLNDLGSDLAELFRSKLPGQMADKVQNVTTGLSEALRIVGDLRQEIGEAAALGDVVAAKKAVEQLRFFFEDTARFISLSSDVDDFRHNSYIWAGKHCSPEAAESMGTTSGTPADYQ